MPPQHGDEVMVKKVGLTCCCAAGFDPRSEVGGCLIEVTLLSLDASAFTLLAHKLP